MRRENVEEAPGRDVNKRSLSGLSKEGFHQPSGQVPSGPLAPPVEALSSLG